MADEMSITGEWVEIGEKSDGGRIVFYREGSDIPPARGRRHLHLKDEGYAGAEAPGPSDKSETTGTGGWFREGKTIHIRVPGWEGDYEIEEVQDNQLILRRR